MTIAKSLRLLGASLALFSSIAFAATLIPVPLLNPVGSTAGQAIVSTGASSAPAWGGVGLNGISAIAGNTVVVNASSASASPSAFAMSSCSGASAALGWVTNSGFACNTNINAATLGGATFAAPGSIGSGTPASGAFTSLSASTTNPAFTYTAGGTGAVARSYSSKLTDIVSVKDYGATGNGSTDDTNAEIAAINAVCAAGGGTVYYPPGTYITDAGSITSFCNGIFFEGAGAQASNIKTNSTTGVLFPFSSLNGIGFSNLTIEYGATATAGSAITLSNSGFFYLENVIVYGAFNPVSITGTNGFPYNIDNVYLEQTATGGTGLYIDGAGDQYINSLLMWSSATTPAYGMHVQGTGGIFMTNSDLVHNGTGMLIDPPSGSAVDYLFIANSAFDTNTNYGIWIYPGGNVNGSTFTGDWTASNGLFGVNVSANTGGTTNGVRFVGHRSFNNGQDGVVLSNGTGTIANVEFGNCDVSGNSQSSSGTYSGFTVAAGTSGFSISGSRSGQEAGFANTQKYGINLSSGATNNFMVSGNDLRGNVTANMLDATTGTTKLVYGNLGYNPIGVTGITVSGSPFTYTNNTGTTIGVIVFGGTVSNITIAGESVSTATGIYVVPQGASIVVTYSSAPAMAYMGY